MTPEALKDLESMLDLFNHEGWKVFQNEVKVNHDTLIYSLANCETSEFPERKGYIKGLAYVLALESMARNAYQNEMEEPNADL